jgi:hypothetical protein
MHIRKIVSTALITAFPAVWLAMDTTFAGVPAPPLPKPVPVPPTHGFVPAWFWAGFACPASIILSGIVADFRDNRQLTTAEAWTCGLLYWIPMPYQPQPTNKHH